jgi:TonB-linked SusC/RagA family outer membrane protein
VPTVPSFGGGTGTKNISEGYTEYAIRGAFGRLTYSYDDKYLLTANMRYDGSSKFPKENRFGFFPSISVGWRLGQEHFMDWSREYLDDFKLRASYGSIGNQNISPYGFIASMGIGQSNVWLDGGDKVTVIGVPGLVRANYTWETVTTLDFGFDLNMFGNRLNAVFDWYKRDTRDMLSEGVELPSAVGAGAPLQNVADMSTKGWELAVTWRDKIGDWNYSIGFNVYDHMSKITKYNNESGNLNYWYNGRDFNQIWGYVSDGYYSINDFDPEQAKNNVWVLKEGVTKINGYTPQPGDEKFKDLNGDGIINTGAGTVDDPGDRKVIGNSTQRFQFGANLGVGYKGFDLSVMLQGVGKRDVTLGGRALFPFAAGGNDGVFDPVYYNQTDYWQAISYDPNDPNYMVPKNPNAKLFRIYGQGGNSGSNARTSDKYLQDGSYMRIKNMTLSYTFPKQWIEKIHLNQLRLYVSVENLATFTSLPKGYDPESLNWSYPFYRTWSVGANISF